MTRILIVTLLESFAGILVQRGIFFYTKEHLSFGKVDNLWLALATGAPYVLGALASHPLSRRLGERRLLLLLLVGQILSLIPIVMLPKGQSLSIAIFICGAVFSTLIGVKWPLVESYVGAGHEPSRQFRAVGVFNITWSGAVPLALGAAGLLIWAAPWALFVAALAVFAINLIPTLGLPAVPVHLPDDHPQRPDAATLTRYRSLLTASRALLVSSYCLMWILAAVLPDILIESLGISLLLAPALAALPDLMRLGMFILLTARTRWHGRVWPLVVAAAAMPVGFLAIMSSLGLMTVLAGEAVFGLAIGMVYYAALYYALASKNASVEAGGAHEALIGSGFIFGPTACLIGIYLSSGGSMSMLTGTVTGVGPLILATTALAVWPLLRLRRSSNQ
ncbi:MAG: MFS transporter [Planctomycetaceae bacterium]|nr:MFS transporter [Planctomycetaceae bacterium]